MRLVTPFGLALLGALSLVACGSSDSSGGSSAGASTGGGGSGSTAAGKACASSADCGTGAVCLSGGGQSACAITCTGSADACGAQGSCGGLGGLSVSVCEPRKADPEAAPRAEESQKRVTCQTDADCDALEKGAVCGTWKGTRGCSIACSSDAQCNPPALGGVTTSFFKCGADEGMTHRQICLPRDECISSPTSCYSIGGSPGGLGGAGGSSGVPGGLGGFGGETGFGGDMGLGGDMGFGG